MHGLSIFLDTYTREQAISRAVTLIARPSYEEEGAVIFVETKRGRSAG